MAHIDLKSKTGNVELREIANTTNIDYPLHIHGTQFQIIEFEISGAKNLALFLTRKDTVNFTSKETVRIKVHHSVQEVRMYQCRIFEHEGSGVMGQLEVV